MSLVYSAIVPQSLCHMPFPRQHRYYDWLWQMLSRRQVFFFFFFKFSAVLIVFCLHLNQLEGSVVVFNMLSEHTIQ